MSDGLNELAESVAEPIRSTASAPNGIAHGIRMPPPPVDGDRDGAVGGGGAGRCGRRDRGDVDERATPGASDSRDGRSEKSTAAAPSSCVRTPSVSLQRARREVRQREPGLHAPPGSGRAAESERRRRRRHLAGGRRADVDEARPLTVTGSVGTASAVPTSSRGARRLRATGRACARSAASPATVAAAALEPFTVDEARRAVRVRARIRRLERDAGRDDVGLDAAVEGEPSRRERGDPAAAGVRGRRRGAERDRHGILPVEARR